MLQLKSTASPFSCRVLIGISVFLPWGHPSYGQASPWPVAANGGAGKFWDGALSCAGRADNGFFAEAAVFPAQPLLGEPVSLVVSTRNRNESPTIFRVFPSMFCSIDVWIRDSSGKFVPMTGDGKRFWPVVASGSASFCEFNVRPGSGYGMVLPLDKFFDLSKPEKYTLIVEHHNQDWGSRRIRTVAKPVTFEVRPPGTVTKRVVATVNSLADRPSYQSSDPFERRWKTAERVFRDRKPGLMLDAAIAPTVSRRAVGLAVSLTNLDVPRDPERWFKIFFDGAGLPDVADAIPGTAAGTKACDYCIMVKDESGAEIPMTASGRHWLAAHNAARKGMLGPGESVGFVFPMDEMFKLETYRKYSAIVVLTDPASNTVWASPTVKLGVPDPVVAGKDIPPYGSTSIWEQLYATAGESQNGYTLSSDVRFKNGDYLLTLCVKHVPSTSGRRQLCPLHGIVLVRDSEGEPVTPLPPTQESVALFLRNVRSEPVIAFGSDPDHSDCAVYELREIYPLRPGRQYTVLSAVNLLPHKPDSGQMDDGDSVACVVSMPVKFTVPNPYLCQPVPTGGSTAASSPPGIKSSSRQHELAGEPPPDPGRFAGKLYGGLQFIAQHVGSSHGDDSQIRLILHNWSADSRKCKKWRGVAAFGLTVRDSNGKSVPMSSAGKETIKSAHIIEGIELPPGHELTNTLSLEALFEIERPGEYTVLATLPVVGDVDALLAATPITFRVKAKADGAKR